MGSFSFHSSFLSLFFFRFSLPGKEVRTASFCLKSLGLLRLKMKFQYVCFYYWQVATFIYHIGLQSKPSAWDCSRTTRIFCSDDSKAEGKTRILVRTSIGLLWR